MNKKNKLPIGKLNNDLLSKILNAISNETSSPKVGQDSAEISVSEKDFILVSTDPITFQNENIGKYCIEINSNDIYASGGIPKWFLLTILIPENTNFKNIEEITNNVSKTAKKYGIEIVGGHTEITSSVNQIILNGTMIGTYSKNFNPNQKVTQNMDIILAGYCGIEGSKIIAELQNNQKGMRNLELYNSSQNMSVSVKDIAITAVNTKNVVKMHDPTEGGIATAIHELCDYANLGCQIYYEKVEFVPFFLETCNTLNINPLGVISSGCLLIISKKTESKKIIASLNTNNIKSKIIGYTKNKDYGKKININDQNVDLLRFDQDEITKILK